MYGKEDYQAINQLFNRSLQMHSFLIASHRGFAHADIIENTVTAMRMARQLGADIMETDTTPTLDDELVMMHPHREAHLFNCDFNVGDVPLSQLRTRHLFNNIGAETNQTVTTFDQFMRAIPKGMLVHLDRNEHHLPLLLKKLDQYPEVMPQIMIKVAPTLENYALLAAHPRKYMVIPIITNADELARTFTQLQQPVNFVGLETVIARRHEVIMTPAFFKRIQAERLAPLANGLNLGLNHGQPVELFGALDDHHSLFGDPLKGWGRMVELGVKMINTDWPAEVARLRQQLSE